MSRYNLRKRRARQAIQVACCSIFVTFSFIYLFAFQSDILTIVQHVISSGRTTYQVFVFSALITVLLSVLPFILLHYIRFHVHTIGLAWFPSFFVLGWLTDVALAEVVPDSTSVGWLPFFLALIVYLLSVIISHQLEDKTKVSTPLANLLWPNLIIIIIGIVFTTLVGNTNFDIHHELRLERLISEDRYDEVLSICAKEERPTRCSMSLRAFALSKNGELGERFFYYPNKAGSDNILPPPSNSLRPANIPLRLREHLGGYPIHDMNATHFLQYLTADSTATDYAKDYLLCALLLDKNLETFVDSLVVYYSDNSTKEEPQENKNSNRRKQKEEYNPIHVKGIPRHYGEALLLYTRMTEKPKAILEDDEILENYLSFQKVYKAEKDPVDREFQCRKYYNETYWTFYYFTK